MMILPKIIIILRTLFINEFTRSNNDFIKDYDDFADINKDDIPRILMILRILSMIILSRIMMILRI